MFLYSCDEAPSMLIIENKANMDVYVFPSTIYPDTTIDHISESRLKGYEAYSVLMFEEKEIIGVAYCDEEIWKTYVKNDTLLLFIFDKHFVDAQPFDSVLNNYLIHKRYTITYDELIANKCKVTVE